TVSAHPPLGRPRCVRMRYNDAWRQDGAQQTPWRNGAMSDIEEKAAAAADATTGAAAEAAETVTDPASRVRRLVRRGAPINRELAKQAEKVARDTARTARRVVDGTIPERVANDGLKAVKSRARQRDLVGVAT